MRPAKRIILRIASFGLGIGCLVGLFGWLALRPVAPVSAGPLPTPNGYDDFVKAGQTVSGNASDYRSMNEEQLRQFVAGNAQALKLVRAGLGKECRVPLELSTNYFEKHLPELSYSKSLCLVLVAEGRLAELENRPADAPQSYLDAIQFSHETVRGGVVIDKLVGIATESLALTPLEKVSRGLEAKDCRKAIQSLEAVEAKREDLEETFKKEGTLSRQGSFIQKLVAMLMYKSFHPERANEQKMQQKVNGVEKRRRMLMLDLAARAYELESGKPPKTLADLTPAYLKSIPLDPDTGTNLVYLLPAR